MGTLWYGDNSTLGLMLAEAAAALAGNSQRAQDRIEQMAQAGSLSSRDVATVLMDSAQQNYDIAMSFHEIFVSRGMSMEANMALAWANDNSAKATYLMTALAEAEQDSDLDDLTIATLAGIDNVGNIVGKNFATVFKKTFKILDGLYTLRDLRDAWNDGDATKIAAISVSWTTGLALGALAVAAVGAAGFVGGAAVVVLGMLSGIAAVAVDLIKDGVDALLEAIPGVQEDEADATARVRNAITQTGTSGTRYIGFDLVFGDEGDDVEVGSDDNPNSIAGGLGNDLLYGGARGDYLAGGDGADTLRAEDGDDVVRGGNGDDILEGGKGSDRLEGGAGFDIYQFFTSDFSPESEDVIVDSDGQGRITFNGLDISGTGIGFDNIRHASLGAWETSDGNFRLVVIGVDNKSLLIIHKETLARIVVSNWNNGDLGITLPGYDEQITEIGGTLSNDDNLFGENGTNDGNDVVNALGGNDGIEGGAGDDYLDGGDGHDVILGGAGDDKVFGGAGNDHIYDGSDQAYFRELSTEPGEDGKSELDLFEEDVSAAGSNLVMRGLSWYVISTPAGHELVTPGWTYHSADLSPSGNDYLDGGEGNDYIYAGEGDDVVIGGVGDDRLVGGHDDDIISGGEGNDTISGDTGHANPPQESLTFRVSVSANRNGNDIIYAGAGDDKAYGNGGNDVIYGGSGNDELFGRGLADTGADSDDPDSDYIDGGDGDDIISGDDGNDTLLGGAGDDQIRGDMENASTRSGNDHIDGGDGNDTLLGDGGDDVILGGQGTDTIGGDSPDMDGSKHGNDVLSGGEGDDAVFGFGGNDVIRGDAGDDQLVGDYDESVLALQFHGDDLIFGGAGNDLIWGGGGNDVLDGGDDDDQMSGDAGDDAVIGGAGADVLYGNDGNDILQGDAGDDVLSGGAGDDVLSGGDGQDQLDAHEGNDSLDGGAGDDILWGGRATTRCLAAMGTINSSETLARIPWRAVTALTSCGVRKATTN